VEKSQEKGHIKRKPENGDDLIFPNDHSGGEPGVSPGGKPITIGLLSRGGSGHDRKRAT